MSMKLRYFLQHREKSLTISLEAFLFFKWKCERESFIPA